jgi:hypothetical protein
MGKRGPKQQYDFNASEIVIDASILSSFKSLASKFNRDLDEPDKLYFDYSFKPNSSKVIARKRVA